MLEDKTIFVEEATGLDVAIHGLATAIRPTEGKNNWRSMPLFAESWFFLEDWLTHSESRPTPSPSDLISMQDCFSRSQHTLNAFVLLILGAGVLPDKLFGSLRKENEVLQLKFVAEER